ncbi:MAG: hypothetical protein ACOY9D_09385 [Pseudomonadota bacterium]
MLTALYSSKVFQRISSVAGSTVATGLGTSFGTGLDAGAGSGSDAGAGADAGSSCNGGVDFGTLNSGCCCNSRIVCPASGVTGAGAALADKAHSKTYVENTMRAMLFIIISHVDFGKQRLNTTR